MRPAYRIIAEGSDITALVRDRLVSLEITDNAGVVSDRLTLSIDDRDERIELPRKGAKIEVSLGYIGAPLVRMGRYTVDEVDVSGPLRVLTIRANAVDMTGAIRSPRERSWDGVTLGNLVSTIAGEHDLIPAVVSTLASRTLGHVDQTESDMQLLQRVCAENGGTCKIADGRLVVGVRASGVTAGGSELPAAVIDASDCSGWNATLSDRGEYKSVKASYQDLAAAARTEVTAGSGEPAMTLRNSYASEAEAKQAADSKLKSLSRGTGKVSINGLVGDPTMSAERPATLVGFRRGIDGSDWVISSVTHSLSDSGYTCGVEIESRQ